MYLAAKAVGESIRTWWSESNTRYFWTISYNKNVLVSTLTTKQPLLPIWFASRNWNSFRRPVILDAEFEMACTNMCVNLVWDTHTQKSHFICLSYMQWVCERSRKCMNTVLVHIFVAFIPLKKSQTKIVFVFSSFLITHLGYTIYD